MYNLVHLVENNQPASQEYTIFMLHRPLAQALIRVLIHKCMGTEVQRTLFTYEVLYLQTTPRDQDQEHTAQKRYYITLYRKLLIFA